MKTIVLLSNCFYDSRCNNTIIQKNCKKEEAIVFFMYFYQDNESLLISSFSIIFIYVFSSDN